MKKKIIVGACILLAVVLLVPLPYHYKDGGTVEYRAVAYSVYDVHRINPGEDREEHPYLEGIIVKIFGVEVFNNVK